MKKVIWCAGFLLLINAAMLAQTTTSKGQKAALVAGVKSKNRPNERYNSGSTITLTTNGNYSAKANTSILVSPQKTLSIGDPLLIKLNERANGANVSFNESGIVGMPKTAYGFANGHLTLKTTGAVTFGTQTGSGAVGTGTSQATFGSIGAPMNVNGKSPHAGINMWGNAMNMTITKKDSAGRIIP